MASALVVLIELIKKPCATVKVIADGEVADDGKRLLCAVANGGFYGGGYHPLPHASISDGMIDVCLVKNVSRIRFVTLIGKYKKGTHIIPATRKVIRVLRCRRLTLEFPEPRQISIDGELVSMDRCEIEVLPAAFRLVLPVGSAPIAAAPLPAESAQ
jgi:diacylglycerol kinase family enzyme